MSANSRRNDADGCQAVDHILNRQPVNDDRGDTRKHNGDFLIQPAFRYHCQSKDDACCHHHSQKRGLACQRAGKRPGKAGIDDDD